MAAIVAENLSKRFILRVRPQGRFAALRALVRPERRIVDAVKGVNFSVDEGEVVAFLGPNGAGKSTTIKMLTGILTPSGGGARVLGLDPARERKRLAWSIGSVFGQKSQLWFHLPPADSFRLLGAVYEVEPKLLRERTGALVERFGLAELMDVPVRKLSLGQRIRCEIAASLIHAPRVLFLDEPTIGLDVVARKEIRRLIEELNKRDGVTVFLTSHDMGDIEKVCKRAVIIHHGEVVVDESMKTLKHRALSRKHVGVRYARPTSMDLPGLSPLKRTEQSARYEVDTNRHALRDVVRALAERGELVDITVEDEPLENVIEQIYAARSGAEAAAVTRGGSA
ncbi:MAG: ATP-binding cassette domain-containing protein [Spirochaetales bacterium]|nr:ATP-binding cassette domain-containing protein [Spirochaetales bacterium]